MRRRLVCGFSLVLPLVIAGCASDGSDAMRGAFPPLRYDYLTPLRLNVAAIEIENHFIAAPGGPASLSPVPPVEALEQMARDRLRADGASGRAVFVVDDSSIVLVPGGLSGSMAVHLDVLTADGRRAGFAEARASQVYTGPTSDIRAVTYDLVKNLMDRMNVEFEYQVRRSLGSWLQVTDTAPPPPVVQQQDLGPPGSLPPSAPAPASVLPPVSPVP
jgi:hypothetical protein